MCAEMGRREVERNRRKWKYEGRTEDGGKPEEGNERTLDREGVWHVCVCAHIHTRSHSSLAETGLLHQFILCYGSMSHFSFVFVCDGDAAQCLKHASKPLPWRCSPKSLRPSLRFEYLSDISIGREDLKQCDAHSFSKQQHHTALLCSPATSSFVPVWTQPASVSEPSTWLIPLKLQTVEPHPPKIPESYLIVEGILPAITR